MITNADENSSKPSDRCPRVIEAKMLEFKMCIHIPSSGRDGGTVGGVGGAREVLRRGCGFRGGEDSEVRLLLWVGGVSGCGLWRRLRLCNITNNFTKPMPKF